MVHRRLTSDFFTLSAAESDWAPVENTLGAMHVTKAPLSWCSTLCPLLGRPSGGEALVGMEWFDGSGPAGGCDAGVTQRAGLARD